ncbi:hypothetical protein [Streptomyces xanthophaeus]|uniref:Lipoprotein n=1 Tax=Streptomyces xanthophaeus TaxID=67385 RepID=A0A919H7U8_9ACTN|nr:hypothetical protein [Streptomyces xanthophaeus]GHI89124.1 hypothetical protein Sxan_64880 [Streptomyces xanthophaeus]
MTPTTARRLSALFLVPALLLPAGCGAGGGVLATDDGRPVPRAQGPHRLWPERSPAPPEPDEVRATDGPTRVAGLAVPKGALRGVRPLDVLRADLGPGAGQPGEGGELRAALEACEDPEAAGCPVRRAHYRDLTGNGRDELILGVELPGHRMNLRVYTADDGPLLRIMDTTARVIDVQLTERDLIIQSTTSLPGTESRDVWTWFPEQQSMVPRLMETVRSPPEQR